MFASENIIHFTGVLCELILTEATRLNMIWTTVTA